jgi:hypothetical protein
MIEAPLVSKYAGHSDFQNTVAGCEASMQAETGCGVEENQFGVVGEVGVREQELEEKKDSNVRALPSSG